MKIKEFYIQSYGPLKMKAKRELDGFNLFWGENEEGKTLTIEALLKLLFQKAAKKFENIERVKGNPEGYVILETRESSWMKVPEAGCLPELAGISAEEADNIFIIRNSRLSIAREEEKKKKEESRFYTSVTDRLTGLRTEKIEAVKNKLKDLGRLTAAGSGASLSNDQRYGKIKDKRNKADEISEKIKNLLGKAEREDIEKIEQSLVNLEDELTKSKAVLERLEEARLRDSYLKAKEALDKLKSDQKTLQELLDFTEEKRNKWWEWKTEQERSKEKEKDLLDKLDVIKKEYEKTVEILKKVEIELKQLERKKEKLNQELELELENYEKADKDCRRNEKRAEDFIALVKHVLILTGITALAYIIHPAKELSFVLIGGILGAFFLFSCYFRAGRCRRKVDDLWACIQKECLKTGISASDPVEIRHEFALIMENWRMKSDTLNDLRVKSKHLEVERKEIEEEIPEIRKKMKELQQNIEKLKLSSGVENLEIYSRRLKEKQEIENRIKVWWHSLSHIFPGQEEEKESKINYWENKLKRLEVYKEKAGGFEYNEKIFEEESSKVSVLQTKIDETKQQMRAFREELAEIEREVNSLEMEEEFIPVETTVDLRAVGEKILKFCEELDSRTEAVLDTLKVFEEIEAEEKRKVTALFGKESRVSEYFYEITNGRYRQVAFDEKDETIKVEVNPGEWLQAEMLSAGAYDQLYFSIRLALGKILLGEEKGFFILDDPFIKADPKRLKTQIEVLKRIVQQEGWQVLYFSAKGEIKEYLEREIENKAVKLFWCEGIDSRSHP